MEIKLPDFKRRAVRLEWGIYAVSALLVFLLVRILKIRNTVNNATTGPGSNNVKAFLKMIRYAEGTDGQDGYRTMFTHRLFTNYDRHPNITNRGNGISSTAAGAYQFLYSTWMECKTILGLPDFGPGSQDKAAVYLIKRRGALADVEAGRFTQAVQKCCKEWASLPVVVTTTDSRGTHPAGKSYYGGQPARTLASLKSKFTINGGTIIS